MSTSRESILGAVATCLLDWEVLSPLGETASETAALLRAGIHNVEASHFIDADGQRVVLSCSSALPRDLIGVQRMVRMAAHALNALHERVSPRFDGAVPGVFLALPEHLADMGKPGELSPDGRALIDELRESLSTGLAGCAIEAFPYGRAGGVLGLERALQRVVETPHTPVYWGGVDSLHDWPVLERLLASSRLLTATNLDGVRPGEGAAFAVLAACGDPPNASAAVQVFSLGLGREPHPVGSETHSRSSGLTTALESAVVPLRSAGRRSAYWLTDFGHERYATAALQTVIARFGDVLGVDASIGMPFKDLGDAGAAAVPILAALAGEAWRNGYAPDDVALLMASSDAGACGAVLLGEVSR